MLVFRYLLMTSMRSKNSIMIVRTCDEGLHFRYLRTVNITMIRSSIYFAFLSAFFVFEVSGNQENDSGLLLKHTSCENMSQLNLPDTKITLAKNIPSGAFEAPDGKSYDVQAFCRIQGFAKTSTLSDVAFEIWLPTSNWSGRYHQYDIGGVRDHIAYSSFAWRLKKGDAITQVDTLGTWPDDPDNQRALSEDSSLAFLSDPEKVFDLTRGHRFAAKRAKAIVSAFLPKAATPFLFYWVFRRRVFRAHGGSAQSQGLGWHSSWCFGKLHYADIIGHLSLARPVVGKTKRDAYRRKS